MTASACRGSCLDEGLFRTLIASYLDGVPCMEIAETHPAHDTKAILTTNLADEKTAIDFYKTIYKKVVEHKDDLPYEFTTLEHELRHIILDEEEHVTELKTLLG
jgi:bacterioferritin (cytochrome b1)